MAAELIIAPEAEQDSADAYDWYESQRIGLGDDFLGRVEACIQRICRMPETHAVVFEGYRRALVRRFPYAVFYEYAEDKVTVYAIYHTSRDPDKWRRRLS
jgi:plasmid stabilization system protein ParE